MAFNPSYDSPISMLYLVSVVTTGNWNPSFPIAQDWADGGSSLLMEAISSTVEYPASFNGTTGYSPAAFPYYAPYARQANIPPIGVVAAGTSNIPCRALNPNERVISKATEANESPFNSDPLFWVRDMTKYDAALAAAAPAASTSTSASGGVTNADIMTELKKIEAAVGVATAS